MIFVGRQNFSALELRVNVDFCQQHCSFMTGIICCDFNGVCTSVYFSSAIKKQVSHFSASLVSINRRFKDTVVERIRNGEAIRKQTVLVS